MLAYSNSVADHVYLKFVCILPFISNKTVLLIDCLKKSNNLKLRRKNMLHILAIVHCCIMHCAIFSFTLETKVCSQVLAVCADSA